MITTPLVTDVPTTATAPSTGPSTAPQNGVTAESRLAGAFDAGFNPVEVKPLAPSKLTTNLSAAAMRTQWPIDPNLTFLNHGSYGSVPKAAMRAQAMLRDRLEKDSPRFYKSDLEMLIDGFRSKIAGFINCHAHDVAPICNATFALCTILANIDWKQGDEVIVTDHEYGSIGNELERFVARYGIKVVKAVIPYPIQDPSEVTEQYLAAVTPKTRLAIIAHITSTSSMIYPITPIITELHAKGIDVLLDGAHTPGQVPFDWSALKPAYFVGSGHKWLCGPKGTGFMVVRADKQPGFRPLALSSRANKIRPDRALFLRDFDYQGTDDYTDLLTIPHSMDAVSAMLPGGWPAVMRANHELAIKGRNILANALSVEPMTPDSMVGSMATLLIPEPPAKLLSRPTRYDDALQDVLFEKYQIVVPIWRLASTDQRLVRISAHLYNTTDDYEYLASALKTELALEWSNA